MDDVKLSAKKWFDDSKLAIAMVLVQVFYTGMQLLTRVILVEGSFIFALLAYRQLIAAISIVPFAFYFERGQQKKFGWWVWFWLFASAIGITSSMALFYYGIRDTTSTYATYFYNLVPMITFVFSIIIRVEKLRLHSRAGKVKIAGALLGFAGALITCLYNGHEFHLGHRHLNSQIAAGSSKAHWTGGTLLLFGGGAAYSLWLIIQVKVQGLFPFKYWATMLTCLIGAIQSTIVGLCLDRRSEAWKLEWNLQLLTIVYSGLLCTAATFCLESWAVAKRGPTYPAIFNPIFLIFVAISEALILGEAIGVGILIGMVLIISGSFLFLYGQRKESKRLSQQNTEPEEQRETNIDPNLNPQLMWMAITRQLG